VESTLFTILIDIFWRTSKIYLGVIFGYLMILSPLKKYRELFVKITINVFTPILIFISILQVERSNEAIFPIFASLLVTFGGIALVKLLSFGRETPKPSEVCTAAFPNALNFPFPLIFALSPDSLGAAGIFLVVQIILRNTVGLWISGVKVSKSNISEILRFPPIWSVLIGLIGRISLQSSIRITLSTQNFWIDLIVEIGIFATLMTLGFGIQKPSIDHINSYLRVGSTRFILTPLILLALLFPFEVPSVILVAMIIQTMAPPAVHNGIYAERFHLDTNLTSNTTLVLTMLALLIIPLEFYLLDYYLIT